jgi:putative heme-binding domain-containing protein
MAVDADAVDRLSAMVRKDEPAARRQAAAALGQIGDARGVGPLLEAAANPDDRMMEHSIIYSLISLKSAAPVQAALRDKSPTVRRAALIALDQMDGAPLRRESIQPFLAAPENLLRSAALWVVSHHPDWGGVVASHITARLRDPHLPDDEMDSVRDALTAFLGDAQMQKLIAELLGDQRIGDKHTILLLDTIANGRLKEIPAAWVEPIRALLEKGGPDVRLRAMDLVRARAIAGLEDTVAKIADDPNSPDPLRASALAVIVSRQPELAPPHYAFLTSRLAADSDPVLRQTAARIIARSTPPKPELLAIADKHLAKADPLVLSTVLECFRSSHDEEVGRKMVSVLRQSPAALSTLGEDRLKALIGGYPRSVQQEAQPLFKQLQEAQNARVEKLRKLEPLLTAGGDVGRGRRIFFGQKVACSSCHTIGVEGANVGPDLTGVGAIRSGHDLLEAIVFPSASFVPGHEVFVVDIGNDRLSGVIRSQSREAVVLVTGPKGEVRIPRSSVKSITPSKVSLMPEGFDETLSKEEMADLLAFLQAEKTRPMQARRVP